MKSRKNLLKKSLLYIVVNSSGLSCDILINQTLSAIKLGADIIQLRNKTDSKLIILEQAFRLRKLLSPSRSLFIVNDYLDVALISKADGVHLGQDDLPIEAARKLMGKSAVIGISCHSLKQAIAAQNSGADYLGIGPVFATPTKPDVAPIGLNIASAAAKRIRIPFFAIGGINKNNLQEIIRCGVKRIAVVRAASQSDCLKDILKINTSKCN